MKNNNISTKKKFSILIKLMKNTKQSQIPPLTEGDTIINDPQEKKVIYLIIFFHQSQQFPIQMILPLNLKNFRVFHR